MDKPQEVISELSDAFEASGHLGDTAKTVAAYLRSEEAIRQMTDYLHHAGQVSISEFVHEMVAIRDRVSYEDDDLYIEDGPLEKEISKEAIFQYYKSASCGWREDYYGDFGIRIYGDGRVEYRTYYYYMKPRTNYETEISPLAAERIRELLLRNQDSMERIPRSLDNGSCDGSGQTFCFGNKMIWALNIEYNDPKSVKKRNPEYYHKYKKNLICENRVFRLFEEICEILRGEGIRLSIHRCEFSANDNSLFSKIRAHIFRKKNK